MPTWSEILDEIRRLSSINVEAPFDVARRARLYWLSQHTGRATILYSTAWTQSRDVPPQTLNINDGDMQGFMETVHSLNNDRLDLILHSPGGSPEAAEPIVRYLRDKFNELRIFVPHAAMSAATMLCCAADEIVMGRQSSIGPIDTQLILDTETGARSVPAQAILDQFEMAKDECQDPSNLGYWTPILRQYGPALLKECEDGIELSKNLAKEWAEDYMFSSHQDPAGDAQRLVDDLSDYGNFRSHSRHIDRHQAQQFGLHVTELESQQKLQDLVLSVYHAASHTHGGTNTTKIIENHKGDGIIQSVQ